MGAKKTMIFSLAAAVLIAVVVLLALNYPHKNSDNNEIRLADVLPVSSGDTAGTGPETENTGLKQLEITADNVQNVIAFLDRIESYHRVIKIYSYWQDGSTEYSIEVWNSPEGTRISSVSEYETKNMLIKDQTLYIWYDNSKNFYSAKIGDTLGDVSHLTDELQMMATYEDVLNLKKSDIVDTGYEVVDGIQYIFVKTTEDELGNEDTYYISLENGLLEFAETKNKGDIIYSMQTVSIEIVEQNSSLFSIPG